MGLAVPLAGASETRRAAARPEGSTVLAPAVVEDVVSQLSINDVTVTEGDAGSVTATFTVSLDSPSTEPVTVDYGTQNGTAVAPADYEAASGPLSDAL